MASTNLNPHVVTLGTAGGPRWWTGENAGKRAGISTAVVVGDSVYLVDAGTGVGNQLMKAGFTPANLRGIFLTHLHSDHTIDLASLAIFGMFTLPAGKAPISIIGPGDRGALPPASPRATTAPQPVFAQNPKSVIRGTLVGMSSYTVQGLMTVWAISYVVEEVGLDRTAVLNIKAIGAALTVVGIWVSSRYSDKLGRRPVMMVGILAGAIAALPIMWMLELGQLWLFAIALFVANGIIQAFIFGPFGAFTAELFPTRIRYTGASLVYRLSSTVGAGFTPMIVAGLVLLGGGSLWIAGGVWAAAFIVAALAMRGIKEGRDADLEAEEMSH
ncbi:UNVERIFIED_CONTAM: MFS transporter [Actinomycetes bacterium ARC8]|nr:MFS transporter [Actinomycetes bacterium ARC8]